MNSFFFPNSYTLPKKAIKITDNYVRSQIILIVSFSLPAFVQKLPFRLNGLSVRCDINCLTRQNVKDAATVSLPKLDKSAKRCMREFRKTRVAECDMTDSPRLAV